ncbi:hypothetical protein M3J07_007506 [Ascochyta lentis]
MASGALMTLIRQHPEVAKLRDPKILVLPATHHPFPSHVNSSIAPVNALYACFCDYHECVHHTLFAQLPRDVSAAILYRLRIDRSLARVKADQLGLEVVTYTRSDDL